MATPQPDVLTISELSSRTGVAPSALRFYERRDLLKPVGRAGGKRTYEHWAIVQVALIDLLKQAGYTLAEIAEIVDADGHANERWRELARGKIAELEAQITFATNAKMLIEHTLACPHPTPAECPVFQNYIVHHIGEMERRAGG